MPKLGDIVTYVTDQGHMRMAFVSLEVIELPKEAEEEQVLVEADVAAEARSKRPSKKRQEEALEEEKPTGPVLSLHVLLHPSDQDYASLGAFGVYAGVPHSDKNVPHSWH